MRMPSPLKIGAGGLMARCYVGTMSEREEKKRVKASAVWGEAREIVWAARSRLAIGAVLMIANRLAGLVLPGSSKFLIDDVIGDSRADLLVNPEVLPVLLFVLAGDYVRARGPLDPPRIRPTHCGAADLGTGSR